ncbi:MAG: universal stress protein [Rhodothermales bacterium]
MHSFKRILVPTDFSLCAEAAYRHALYLARQHKAEVHLFHVATPSERGNQKEPNGPKLTPFWPNRTKAPHPGTPANTERWFDFLLRRAVGHHPDPVSAILDYARQHAVDLIVMGAHGDRGAGHYLNQGTDRAFLGQTVEQVVRHAACPVYRVVMQCGQDPEQVRRILVPVDLSSLSLRALSYAKDLALLYKARLDLLHVIERGSFLATQEQREATHPKGEEQIRAEIMEAYLNLPGDDLSTQVHVLRGRPDREIRAFVERRDIDLVVMGAHSDLGKDLLGIVAEQVVRTAPCLVLTMRDGQSKGSGYAKHSRSVFPVSAVFL